MRMVESGRSKTKPGEIVKILREAQQRAADRDG
jgi:hypothetical protein